MLANGNQCDECSTPVHGPIILRRLVKSNLVALVLGDATTAPVGSTAAASAEAATATAASTTTESTTAAAATTTRSITVGWAGRGEVEPESTAFQFGTVEVVHGLTGLIDTRILHVSEALGTAGLALSRQADAHDGTLFGKQITQRVLVRTEGKVAHEESVALGAGLVAE